MVVIKIEGGQVILDADGISLLPSRSRKPLQIAWKNVMFVSPIPAVSKEGGNWQTFRAASNTPLRRELLTKESLALGLPFYTLEVAVSDRSLILAAAGFFTRLWLVLSANFAPLYTGDMKPHPTNGVVRLRLQKRWLRRNGVNLITALETVEKYSRFDQLFSDD